MGSPPHDGVWQVDAVPEFTAWLRALDPAAQEKVVALRRLLEIHGPTLGRPYADRVKGSARHNLKELRPSSGEDEALRVLFYFDRRRLALFLVGGDKSGDWSGWYERNIPIAEARIARHEAESDRAVTARSRLAGPRGAGKARRRTRRSR